MGVRIAVGTVGAAALLVVAWVALTAWDPLVHGHPAYAVLLGLTLAGGLAALAWALRWAGRRGPVRGWRLALVIIALVLAVGWLAALAWLRPFGAVEPALSALVSDDRVVVDETATSITLAPTGTPSELGVVFQPGARVDARAYAAVLRPLAEAGHLVVIPKQPLGIGFLAPGAVASAIDAHPDVRGWVAGGHSLGGTVASAEAPGLAGVEGLLLFASYPAGDISGSLDAEVLSLSGSNDGLATPADIEASRADLPPGSRFVVIDGAVHAFFGDYGDQPGDGVPTITHDEARARISEASVAFVDGLAATVASLRP